MANRQFPLLQWAFRLWQGTMKNLAPPLAPSPHRARPFELAALPLPIQNSLFAAILSLVRTCNFPASSLLFPFPPLFSAPAPAARCAAVGVAGHRRNGPRPKAGSTAPSAWHHGAEANAPTISIIPCIRLPLWAPVSLRLPAALPSKFDAAEPARFCGAEFITLSGWPALALGPEA